MFEAALEQASGLRRLFRQRTMRLLPVIADPRPADSASFALNLAAALGRAGWNPIVIDAHRQGVASLLGLELRHDLEDLIEGRCRFAQALRRGRDGVPVLAAQRGFDALARDPRAAEAVFSAVASLEGAYDVALVHAPAASLGALLQAQDVETTLLCGPDEADLTETYARLKSMVNDYRMSQFRVIFDGFDSQADVAACHRRLAAVAARFLDAAVSFGGSVARDADLDEAVRERTSVFAIAARGPAARAFERIASAAHEWRLPAFTPDRRTIH